MNEKKRWAGTALALLLSVSLGACTGASGSAAQSGADSSQTTATAQSDSTQSGRAQNGFIALFDGETLANWHRHENLPGDQVGGEWTVEDGAITGDQDPPGHGGFLVTDQAYRDYVLTLETRLDYPVDSGVFLRVGEDGKSHQVTLDHRPGGTIGAIYMAYLGGFVEKSPQGKEQFARGAWNALKVRIEGAPARIQVWLNGARVTDFQHTEETSVGAPATGSIGLQVHPGESYEAGQKVRFRNIRIRPL